MRVSDVFKSRKEEVEGSGDERLESEKDELGILDEKVRYLLGARGRRLGWLR